MDEKESGLRRILNFGHTIAHAVEKITDYEKYRHGEAVAIGMLGAALISWSVGRINFNDVARLKDLLDKLFAIKKLSAGKLIGCLWTVLAKLKLLMTFPKMM